jgi:predicted TIM-barrel fold metal-dependent hydrolase
MQGSSIFPIIDTHQHLWDLTRFRLPWLKDRPALDRSYLPDDYVKATADLGCYPAGTTKDGAPGKIVKTIYMEVDLDPVQQAAEAEYVLEVCGLGNTPMVAAVISGRPASAGFKEYVTRYRDSKYIKGVRQVLHVAATPPGCCLDDNFIRGIRLLGELGLSYDLCLRPQELLDGAKLIDACPGTRFILDHCGNADVKAADHTQWKCDIAEVAKRKNVVCKISGIVVSAKPGKWTADDLAPFIHHASEAFGRDRIFFGGDWPVCTQTATYQQWLDALKWAVSDWNEQDQRKLFHDNAVRFYGLA